MARPSLGKRLGRAAEGIALWPLYGVFRLLGPDTASALGGAIGRLIGPSLPIHAAAARRLARALPDLELPTRQAALAEMWENFGRLAAELAHLDRLAAESASRLEIRGAEHLAMLAEDGQPGIVVTAHFGNFELCSIVAAQLGLPLAQIYRRANNPWVERLLRHARGRKPGSQHGKGAEGARALLGQLTAGQHVGLAVDQRMNDGIPLPFLGRTAMTAPAAARLALRFRCPIVPLRIERLAGCRFLATAEAPLTLPETGDPQADERQLMLEINRRIENWVRARPGQWLWLHNRWGD